MSDPISRLNAALDGRYRVERELGQGGMATVYLAHDLRHDRKVALKVLKPELAALIGAERFLAEIKTTANLQHPHVLPLFDSGEADGFLFYVMPYVEGETLRDRLDRERQLPLDEAVRIVRAVAGALDYAHRQGIVHRDIKPANILIHDGQPVVSDFGIALAVTSGGAGRLTETGLSLGTPHYMSPEQATGEAHVGPPTDVYALGCVLYELLAGEPPYTGSTPQAILGRIIQSRPVSVAEARASAPPHVDASIRKALEKVPADRFPSASAFSAALAEPGFRHGPGAEAPAGTGAGAWNRLSLGLAAAVVLLAGVAGWALLRAPPPAPVTRQVLSTDGWEGTALGMGRYAALAPDGSSMILRVEGSLGLKLRGATDVVPIQGTEGARDVQYSPDGQWIVYAIGLDLFKRPVAGGPPVRLADDAQSTYLALDWPEDETIYYEQEPETPQGRRGIVRIPSNGGEPVAVFDPPEVMAPAWLDVLPEGRGLLVNGCPGAAVCGDRVGLYVVDASDGSYERVLDGAARAWYTPTGHVVYVDVSGAVFARAFDLRSLEFQGDAVPLFDGVRTQTAWVDMRLAANGTMLYVEGDGGLVGGGGSELVAMDLEGNAEPLPLAPRRFSSGGFGWSRDGRSIVFASDGQIYTYDVVLNTTPRQLTDEGFNTYPVFSPDGSQVVFSRRRTGDIAYDVYVIDVDGDEPPRLVVTGDGSDNVMDWPTDSLIFFMRYPPPGSGVTPDLWIADLSDPERPSTRPYLTSEDLLIGMVLSPDGGLLAYTSAGDPDGLATGGLPVSEVQLRTFPEPGARTLVAGGLGAFQPAAWSGDGSTLYYGRSTLQDARLFAARIERSPELRVVATDTLFTAPITYGVPMLPSGLHPDRGLLVARPIASTGPDAGAEARAPRVILVENFFEELRERVGR